MKEHFPELEYQDIAGLCKVATVKQIEAQGWSLNPGRYVGVRQGEADDVDFLEHFGELTEEFQGLSIQSQELQEQILQNSSLLLSDASREE